MGEIIPKVIRWALSVFFLLFGVACVALARNGETWTLIFGIFSFGVVYIQNNKKNKMPKEVMIASVIILATAAFLAKELHRIDIFPYNGGFFTAWIGWALTLGIPGIYWAYKKYD